MNSDAVEDRILYKGKYLAMVKRAHWEFASRRGCTGAVVIVPKLLTGEYVFVRQYRLPLGNTVVEFPAGLVGDDGDPEECFQVAARRELLEEVGCEAANFRILGQVATSPGMSDEVITYLAADDCIRVAPGGGLEGEEIEVVVVPEADADKWLLAEERGGRLISGTVYCGLRMRRGRDHHPELFSQAR